MKSTFLKRLSLSKNKEKFWKEELFQDSERKNQAKCEEENEGAAVKRQMCLFILEFLRSWEEFLVN